MLKWANSAGGDGQVDAVNTVYRDVSQAWSNIMLGVVACAWRVKSGAVS